LQPVWTTCTVGSHSHALWGGVSKVQPGSGTDRDFVEVNVSKSSFKQRAARFAVASGIAFVAIAPTAAMAYPNPGGTSTPSDPGSQVEAAKTTRSSTLPFTGGDVAGLATIGAGAVVAGAVVVRQSRRRAVA
jgi:hypothetical protein